jgi:hypothetical protein
MATSATAAELMAFLKANPPEKKFVPYTFLNKEADALTVYFEGDPDYSKRLNDHVTLFLSLDTHEIVGCRIKGISGIISDLPNFLRIQHHGIELSIVFLSFRGGAEDEATRNAINSLGKVAGEKNMKLETSLI